jgi:hypothetical protein
MWLAVSGFNRNKENSDRPQNKADVFSLKKITEDWQHAGLPIQFRRRATPAVP